MKSFKHFPRPLVVALAAPLLLAACTQNGPWAMPTGYVYHHGELKAPPGPQPVLKKWEYRHGLRPEPQPMPSVASTPGSAVMPVPVTEVLAAPATNSWQQAADELVSRLIADFGRPAEAVWLEADAPGAEGFDGVLRIALAAHNIAVADAPGASPFTLRYNVGDSGDSSGHKLLTITLMSGGTRVESESGLYVFSSDGGVVAVAPSSATATAAPQLLSPQAMEGESDAVRPALVIDSSPSAPGDRPKPSGMADDIEPGPMVRPIPPEHVLNDDDIKPSSVVMPPPPPPGKPYVAPLPQYGAPEEAASSGGYSQGDYGHLNH